MAKRGVYSVTFETEEGRTTICSAVELNHALEWFHKISAPMIYGEPMKNGFRRAELVKGAKTVMASDSRGILDMRLIPMQAKQQY